MVCVLCEVEKKAGETVSSAADGGDVVKTLAKGPDASLPHGPNKKLLLYVSICVHLVADF